MIRYFFILLFSIAFPQITLADKDQLGSIKQSSMKGLYQAELNCKNTFSSGSFQVCSFNLFKDTKAVENEKIFLNGGMPAHQHGLPTSPKVIWNPSESTYIIEGLRFSMPGKWELIFQVVSPNVSGQDEIKFSIVVD